MSFVRKHKRIFIMIVLFINIFTQQSIFEVSSNNATISDNLVLLQIQNSKALIDYTVVNIDDSDKNTKPILVNNATFVPLRFIFEGLGGVVYWDENNRDSPRCLVIL